MTGRAHATPAAVSRVAEGERTDAEAVAEIDERAPASTRDRSSNWVAAVVLVVGLIVTGALALVSHAQYTRNERRLLDLRVREVGSLLSSALPNIQTPLASATALADATNGDARRFTKFIAPYVGARPAHQFVSVSLWRLDDTQRGPVAVVGLEPTLAGSSPAAAPFLARAQRSSLLTVIGLWPPTLMRLGYALVTPGAAGRFVAYGESALPSNRRSRFERNSAFSDLDYVLYLGRSTRSRDLLVTSVADPPVRGQQAKMTIPFGDTVLTLVVAPRQSLSGTLPQNLPWIIAIVGAVLSVGAAALTLRLIQRRRAAEHLARRLEHAVDENQRLYAEQHSIAQTLQHALLPERLPELAGTEAIARYEAGERGVEIGGDWYDLIPVDEQRVLLVVGDVSGRGLRAAATMASLRYAIRAYAAQSDPPATILSKLSRMLDVRSTSQFATVLCALIDVGSHQVTISSAGHLPPLLISDGHGAYVKSDIGLPIGVQADAQYASVTISTPPQATLLAFTDGLVERRGEPLDDGLARLRDVAVAAPSALPELVARLIAEMRRVPSDDDTAIVGVRWRS